MRRAILVLIVLVSAALTSTAAAQAPTIQQLDPIDYTYTGPCSFPVHVHIVVEKQVSKTFSDGRTLITGKYKVTLSNVDAPTKTLDLIASGPARITINADGTVTVVGVGLGFGPIYGTSAYVKGRVIFTVGPGGITADQQGGTWQDICAALAA